MASEVGTSRSTALRCYVSAVSALGVALFGWCVTRVVTVGVPVEWWMFAALTFISGRITLNVPGVEATFTVSEVFAFASVLLFGPEAGAVTLALDSLVLAWHRRMGVDKAAVQLRQPDVRPSATLGIATARLRATLALRASAPGSASHLRLWTASAARERHAWHWQPRHSLHGIRLSTRRVPSPGRLTMTCGSRRVRAA